MVIIGHRSSKRIFGTNNGEFGRDTVTMANVELVTRAKGFFQSTFFPSRPLVFLFSLSQNDHVIQSISFMDFTMLIRNLLV